MVVVTRSTSDPEFTHILSTVLMQSNGKLRDALADVGVITYRDLVPFSADHNKVNSLKWKNTNGDEEDVPDGLKDEVKEIYNFINYMQNKHGDHINFPIDVCADTSRRAFDIFLALPPISRNGESNGTVHYDRDQARKSEEHNGLGRFGNSPPTPAPSSASTPATASTSANSSGGARSISTSELAFDKSITPLKPVPKQFKYDGNWPNWKRDAWRLFVVYKLDTILHLNYVIPTDINSTQFSFYTKSNLIVFSILKENVLTDNGQRIINKHEVAQDGRCSWLDLVTFYEKNFNAKNARLRLHKRITNIRADPNIPRVRAITIFQKLITEHNSYCEDSSDRIEGRTKLNYFESYLSTVDDLSHLMSQLDLDEDKPGATPYTVEYRMEACEKKAHQLDTLLAEKLGLQRGSGSNSGNRRRLNVNSTLITDEELYGDSFGGLYGAMGSDDYDTVHVNQAHSHEFAAMFEAYMTDVEELYANASESDRRKPGYLPKSIYQTLDPDHRRSWMSIPAVDRERIISSGNDYVAPAAHPASNLRSDSLRPGTARKARVNYAAHLASLREIPVDQEESVSLRANTAAIAALRDVPVEQDGVNVVEANMEELVPEVIPLKKPDIDYSSNTTIIQALQAGTRLKELSSETKECLADMAAGKPRKNSFASDVFLSKANVSKKTRVRIQKPNKTADKPDLKPTKPVLTRPYAGPRTNNSVVNTAKSFLGGRFSNLRSELE